MFSSKSFFIRLISTYILIVVIIVIAMAFYPLMPGLAMQIIYPILILGAGIALGFFATKINYNLMIKPMKEIIETNTAALPC